MIAVLAIDALEPELVEKFHCDRLMQRFHGRTDISDFSEPRTMVLWSSFMTGTNMEREILALGDRAMWDFHLARERTFFADFRDPVILDLPGYSYDIGQHEKERRLLKDFFEARSRREKDSIQNSYNEISLQHHRRIKSEFAAALKGPFDLVLGYFSAADVIGHLNFSDTFLMRMIYQDLDEIAGSVQVPLIILSDHGMRPVGKFGDHTEYGFWSSSTLNLGIPRITDFHRIILDLAAENSREGSGNEERAMGEGIPHLRRSDTSERREME